MERASPNPAFTAFYGMGIAGSDPRAVAVPRCFYMPLFLPIITLDSFEPTWLKIYFYSRIEVIENFIKCSLLRDNHHSHRWLYAKAGQNQGLSEFRCFITFPPPTINPLFHHSSTLFRRSIFRHQSIPPCLSPFPISPLSLPYSSTATPSL